MNIFGIGVDIVEIARIDALITKHGDRFLARVFTAEERRYCSGLRAAGCCYAARFAAKEAVSKAFGTGIGPHVGWLDVQVERGPEGQPSVRLENAAAAFAAQRGINQVLVSLSHSEHYAVAQAIALGTA